MGSHDRYAPPLTKEEKLARRGGTARRDIHGTLLPGEYDGQHRPLDGSRASRPMSPTYQPTDFRSFFAKPTGAQRLQEAAHPKAAPQAAATPAAPPPAAKGGFSFGSGMGTKPADAPAAKPNTGGGTVTSQMADQGVGARESQVVGIDNPPPVGNQNPDVVTRYKGLPDYMGAPKSQRDRNGNYDPAELAARSDAFQADLAAHGGHVGSRDETTITPVKPVHQSHWWDDPTSPRVQRLLDTAAGISPTQGTDAQLAAAGTGRNAPTSYGTGSSWFAPHGEKPPDLINEDHGYGPTQDGGNLDIGIGTGPKRPKPLSWDQLLVQKYPALGVKDSPENKAFVAAYRADPGGEVDRSAMAADAVAGKTASSIPGSAAVDDPEGNSPPDFVTGPSPARAHDDTPSYDAELSAAEAQRKKGLADAEAARVRADQQAQANEAQEKVKKIQSGTPRSMVDDPYGASGWFIGG